MGPGDGFYCIIGESIDNEAEIIEFFLFLFQLRQPLSRNVSVPFFGLAILQPIRICSKVKWTFRELLGVVHLAVIFLTILGEIDVFAALAGDFHLTESRQIICLYKRVLLKVKHHGINFFGQVRAECLQIVSHFLAGSIAAGLGIAINAF